METQRFAPSDQIVTTEQAVFDVRLTVTSDVILPANSSLVSEANTTIVHKVTFTVVPPTNSMNVSAAKIRFWTAIQNSTIFTHVDDILDDMYNQEYIVPADLSSIVRSALSVATSNRSCSNDKNSSSSAFCGNETVSCCIFHTPSSMGSPGFGCLCGCAKEEQLLPRAFKPSICTVYKSTSDALIGLTTHKPDPADRGAVCSSAKMLRVNWSHDSHPSNSAGLRASYKLSKTNA